MYNVDTGMQARTEKTRFCKHRVESLEHLVINLSASNETSTDKMK